MKTIGFVLAIPVVAIMSFAFGNKVGEDPVAETKQVSLSQMQMDLVKLSYQYRDAESEFKPVLKDHACKLKGMVENEPLPSDVKIILEMCEK